MMILHLVNKQAVFSECIAHLAAGDCVALIESAATPESAELFRTQLDTCSLANINIYTIENAMTASFRRRPESSINTSSDSGLRRNDNTIDMNELVELTTTARTVVSWY